MKRAAIYLRVSTLDQTTANQEQALREAAERSGLEIVEVYRDHGIGGVARFRFRCASVSAQHLEQRLALVKHGQQRTGFLKGAGIVATALPVQPIHQQYHHINY